MSAWSTFAQNKLVDAAFRSQALAFPATWYVALVTVAGVGGANGTEVTGGSYARVAVAASLANFAGTQGAASTAASSGTDGTTSNNATITYPAPTAGWGQVVGAEFWDAESGGNFWAHGVLTTPKTVNSGDPAPSFAPAALSFQVDH